MADLQVFQVPEPVVGGSDLAQVLFVVDEHQARAVDAEHRMCSAYDLADRVFDPHLAEAELAKVPKGLMHIVQ